MKVCHSTISSWYRNGYWRKLITGLYRIFAGSVLIVSLTFMYFWEGGRDLRMLLWQTVSAVCAPTSHLWNFHLQIFYLFIYYISMYFLTFWIIFYFTATGTSRHSSHWHCSDCLSSDTASSNTAVSWSTSAIHVYSSTTCCATVPSSSTTWCAAVSSVNSQWSTGLRHCNSFVSRSVSLRKVLSWLTL